MEKEKLLLLARFVEYQIEAEIDNVLNDSEDDPHFSAVYTTSLINVCSELLTELGEKPLSYNTVEEYFALLGYTRRDYELFEEKRKKEAEHYIGEQY